MKPHCCKSCNSPITTRGRRGRIAVYCSAKCKYHGQPRGARFRRTCVACGTLFIASKKRKYCSNACCVKRYPIVKQNCQSCGNEIERRGKSATPRCNVCQSKRAAQIGHSITYASTCKHCSASFVGTVRRRFCSKSCSNKFDCIQKRNRRRAVFVEPVSIVDVHRQSNGVCAGCGLSIDLQAVVPHRLKPSIDHIVPVSKGGEHSLGNTQLMHVGCNSRKHARWNNGENRPAAETDAAEDFGGQPRTAPVE